MFVKEYRIPLPLSVAEYRIAQLYMIAKKSREETKGAGSGVEILVNEPYDSGPGGSGQYTHKIYHIGSHLPSWFKSLLPKSALTVEEEAWNAYPYTKTRYTCPFVQRFSLEIETYYCDDAGHQENVFELSNAELRNRVVDVIDVVRDQLHGADYVREEDPRIFHSSKTGRGPLKETWIEDFENECKEKKSSRSGNAIMCAYKLCRVEFHYWGMQTKIEKFIHDVALRKTMLRAHRQAWAWQDEWVGLTMQDIRAIERETQETLKQKMAGRSDLGNDDDEECAIIESSTESSGTSTNAVTESNAVLSPSGSKGHLYSQSHSQVTRTSGHTKSERKSDPTADIQMQVSDLCDAARKRSSAAVSEANTIISSSRSKNTSESSSKGAYWPRTSSKTLLTSPASPSPKSYDLLATLRMESIMRRDSDSGSEDEFFDCLDGDDAVSLTKWSSLDLIPQDSDSGPNTRDTKRGDDSIFCQPFIHRVTIERERSQRSFQSRGSVEASLPGSPTIYSGLGSSSGACSTTVLCLVIHAGSALDATMDLPAKKSDVTTFKGAFESVIRQHYPSMMGHVVIKLVPCPSLCTDALGILSSLSPYSFDMYGGDGPQMTHETVPIGAIPILCSSQPEYWDAVAKTVQTANQVYHDFLKSEEGHAFSGQVVFIGDSMGSILAYDALTRHSHSAQYEDEIPPSPAHGLDVDHLHVGTAGSRRRSSSSASDSGNAKLDFDIAEFFMFGSPLGLVLAHRKVHTEDRQLNFQRPCHQVYNLFHPTDPLATRLEPLISARFSAIAPINVARYVKYPLGNGVPFHLLESIQSNSHLFADTTNVLAGASVVAAAAGATSGSTSSGAGIVEVFGPAFVRRLSDISVQSGMSGLNDGLPMQAINSLTQKWWGNKRIDFALYCPEALANFPTNSLPHLFHASYWESTDAIAFILRQIGLQDSNSLLNQEDKEIRVFTPNEPREKWQKKRTSVKLKNVAANHRANDIIVKEGLPQVLKARFMYGPLDMVTLTGEKVDIYIMKDPPMGEWIQVASEITDKNGRVTHTLPPEKSLGYGIYPIKMVVRGDHTCADFYLTIVPPKTECIVFSIDGSFTASMSVTGRDPRVRAGAVDVVRHWQELGYLIIYVTGRPDMQQHKVVSWLAQHNFPHGLVSFADGLSTDFLGHKADYLKNLVQEHKLVIHAAYGSSKDISVYTSVGVLPERIYIIGKVSKKQHSLATVLSDGYSAHLDSLTAHGGSRPAQGNARMVIPRTFFGLPGQPMSMRRRRSAKRTTSYPVMSQSSVGEATMGATTVAASLMNTNLMTRGVSRRIKPSH